MAISDALHTAYENLLRVIPKPPTTEEEAERVRTGRGHPDVDPAALHDGARRFVDALSADPAAAAELTRRGTLCAKLTAEGSEYLTAKTNAQKALHRWKPKEAVLQHLVNHFQHQGGRELVADVRHEYERLDHLLGFNEVPEETRVLLTSWRDAAWSIVSQGENESLDGCYWLLQSNNLRHALCVPQSAPEVRQAADALVRWQNAHNGISLAEPVDDSQPTTKSKRSTVKGEGREKLIAALTLHHEYADGGSLNLEPIGNNELARKAGVDRATASAFFKKQFKGHGKYKAACRDSGRLAATLKLLNGEFAPHLLYGAKPPNEDDRDEEE